ncbi:hypothetical protein WISP_144714 [Willisornis vidua]|uniref:Uncharacterized protein n=1 Tax=Willisornis vidua TaxID=1566151 RepID=A0ABQ9CQK6_9PASS|nr:hypothetical protein WISP_144714 [Willisornis vidua]
MTGVPKRRYKDSLKQHLSLGHIDYHQWSTLASSWDSWRHTIHDTAASFENTQKVGLEEKRQRRKNRSLPISPKETFHCTFCNWTFPEKSTLLPLESVEIYPQLISLEIMTLMEINNDNQLVIKSSY